MILIVPDTVKFVICSCIRSGPIWATSKAVSFSTKLSVEYHRMTAVDKNVSMLR